MSRRIRASLIVALAVLGVIAGSPNASAGAPVPLYTFQNENDGGQPVGNLVADPAGNLFGVTYEAAQFGEGLVFELSPPAVSSSAWTYRVLYTFTGTSDGGGPAAGLVRDAGGNLYGTTNDGGLPNCLLHLRDRVQAVAPALRIWRLDPEHDLPVPADHWDFTAVPAHFGRPRQSLRRDS